MIKNNSSSAPRNTVANANARLIAASFEHKAAAKAVREHLKNIDLESIKEDSRLPELVRVRDITAGNLAQARIALQAVSAIQ